MKKSAISNEEDEALAQYNINLLIMADSWVPVHRDKLQEINTFPVRTYPIMMRPILQTMSWFEKMHLLERFKVSGVDRNCHKVFHKPHVLWLCIRPYAGSLRGKQSTRNKIMINLDAELSREHQVQHEQMWLV
ncbi:hypothetical protein RRG08_045741 [Elysia crispata]|uniref:Uncharacterized protein n=1 Tax=Elysia crispata TaxID=231223 RepID=A0AAE1DD17_9GAST|nr:hypothetical protein RRG08_045741 [Elysia crispata]